jgi:hypothetical protein
MRVVVVTVYAPRPEHPKFIDYLPFLRVQKLSAERFEHKHVVVTDADLGGEFREIRTPLSQELMPAMIEGVLAGLRAANGKRHLVFVDADCLINRDLRKAFASGEWDIGLTRREHDSSPINNGAMFINGESIPKAIAFFERSLSLCGTHWGADQEAISAAAAPVPDEECVQDRDGTRIGFLSMKKHSAVPAKVMARHDSYVVHFKGSKKEWMLNYAHQFLGL